MLLFRDTLYAICKKSVTLFSLIYSSTDPINANFLVSQMSPSTRLSSKHEMAKSISYVMCTESYLLLPGEEDKINRDVKASLIF